MRALLLIFVFFSTMLPAIAQEDAWVYFTGKPNADFYLDNPLEMLSQKALDRRAVQGIELDEMDVPLHQDYVDGVEVTVGITVMARSKWLNAVHVRGLYENIELLSNLDYVSSIEYANKTLNTPGRPAHALEINAVNKQLDVAVNLDYGMGSNQIQMLNGHILHQEDYTGTGMTIAVMDSGFPGVDTAGPFERLQDNGLILGGYNFVNGDENVYTANQHGTLVLSTIGGYVEGGLIGTAPDAFYYLFVTEDTTGENPVEESYWVEAAEMADSLGVDVINTSLGYFDYDNPAYNYTYEHLNGQTSFISRGANIAFSRGMICVTSAGNSGNSADPYIQVPADAFNTLTVGAVNFEETREGFSSIGLTADGRIKPDVMAQGSGVIYAKPDGTISFGNGTSFSSPITAGLVACLWQAFPEKTNVEILELVKGSADRFTNPGPEYGYGIPDFAFALNELAVSELSKQDFVLYPNPVKNLLNVALPTDVSNATLTVYNSLGQIVMLHELTANTAISLEKLSTGLYSYRIDSANRVKMGKLIKK